MVRAFNAGEFNVLVATSIAEEGLDISEVDLVVSYDVVTSPVRMLQVCIGCIVLYWCCAVARQSALSSTCCQITIIWDQM